ncbi:MAG: FAD-binding protein [Acidobacteria bacterium]|nr:FAD-binding protein [Acidobacteriota bacterium]
MTLAGKLRQILPAGIVLTDSDALERYGQDETEDLVFKPAVVVKPVNTVQVVEVMRFAHQERVPVTPRGAGTGLSGGALPVEGGIVLSTESMNRIVEIDTRNLVAVVEPGVITQVLQDEVEKVGLFYPPDPASRGSCTIGGNIAECAGGPRALKYGVTKEYVLGVEAVLASGDVVEFGGKLFKDVTGYNMTQLFVGSEGTLGIVTKAVLRLIPYPPFRKTLIVPFAQLESAATAVAGIFQAGVVPCACELLERDVVRRIEQHRDSGLRFPDADAHLLIELDSHYEDTLDRDLEKIAEVCESLGAADILVADGPAKQKELWDWRRSAGEAVKSRSVYKEEDTVVPRARLPDLIRGVKEIAARHGISTLCYGHAGDGNIHVNIVKDGMDDHRWEAELPGAVEEIFRFTKSLGGTLSGEHGIGFSQKRYLPIVRTEAEIALMRAVKAAFDPLGILNPGKIFP